MGREKGSSRGKEIRSESKSEEEEDRSSDEEYGIHVHAKRSKPQAPPTRVQGHGRGKEGNPPLVNYIKAGTDMRPHRYHDQESFKGPFP
jgi:hypothetical protein